MNVFLILDVHDICNSNEYNTAVHNWNHEVFHSLIISSSLFSSLSTNFNKGTSRIQYKFQVCNLISISFFANCSLFQINCKYAICEQHIATKSRFTYNITKNQKVLVNQSQNEEQEISVTFHDIRIHLMW